MRLGYIHSIMQLGSVGFRLHHAVGYEVGCEVI